MSKYSNVQEFYDAMGFPRPAVPSTIDAQRRNQLMAYLLSEAIEFGNSNNLLEQLDAATDLLYFVMDIFVELGVDPATPFDIVHRSNMSKIWNDGYAHFDWSVVPPRMLRPKDWVGPEEALARYLGLEMAKDDDT